MVLPTLQLQPKCCTYDVGYISIIPGRMEEVGIDAQSAIAFVNQCNFGNTEIITGSQRTTEQIIYSFYLDTVPTIGEKCWADIFQGDNFQRILNGVWLRTSWTFQSNNYR